ncbi:Aste57867_9644 [Aphanomyces stellatus]|uniref:histone acetyltransferase n=1 Tax=Aphanomyces stellatus TaxID=120398 RepID=A0A485KNG3_9STRA|nr:hypothetical protein As57867_009606 [Aphanomyces stellatus]VFT86523.1 Aste57867_9644 [Aphanomyces stellatus]
MDKTFVGDFGLGMGDATNLNMFPFNPAAANANMGNNPMAGQMNNPMGANNPMNMGQYNAFQMGNMGNMFMPNGAMPMGANFNGGAMPDDMSTANASAPSTGGAIDFPEEFNPQAQAMAPNMMGMNPGMQMNPMMMNNMMAMNPNQFGFQQMMNNQMFGMNGGGGGMNGLTPQQQQYLRQQQYAAQQQMLQARAQAMMQAQAAQQQPPAAMPSNAAAAAQPPAPAWQSEKSDTQIRHEVINKIVAFLRNQKPNAPADWIRRLPQMAKKLEEKLYRSARTKDEYVNEGTLKARLQVVARSFHAARTQNPPELAAFCQKVAQISATLPAQSTNDYHQKVLLMLTDQEKNRLVLHKQHQRLLLLRHAMWCQEPPGTCKGTPQCVEMKALWGHVGVCANTASCPFEHCTSSKFVLSHFHQCTNAQCIVCHVIRQPIEAKDVNGGLILDPTVAMLKLNSLKRTASEISMPAQSPTANAPPPAANAPTSAPTPNGVVTPVQIPPSNAPVPMPTPSPTPPVIPGTPTAAGTPPVPGTQQYANQLAMIQQRFKDWSLEQLQNHSKKLEGWAEQLKGQMHMISAECTKQFELFKMALDPAAKMQYQSQVEEGQRQLKEVKAKFARCVNQHKVMTLTINGRLNGGGAMNHQSGMNQAAMTQAAMHQAAMNQAAMHQAAMNQAAMHQAAMHPNGMHPSQGMNMMHHHAGAMATPHAMAQTNPLQTSLQNQSMQSLMQSALPPPAVPSAPDTTAVPNVVAPPVVVKPPTPSQVAVKTEEVAVKAEDTTPKEKKLKTEPKVEPEAALVTGGTCMLPQMTNEEIQAHIDALQQQHCASMTVAQLKKKLDPILKNMMEHKFGWVFSTPVDPVAYGIPTYFDVIKRPMDLGTIKKKLEGNFYKHIYPFAADVRLTFRNALTFNSEGEDVHTLAGDMLRDFNGEMAKLEAEINVEEAKAREKEGACKLCGAESLVFEPAVLYCNGECNTKIRRNNYFFCSGDNKYHCCVQCYPNLPESIANSDGGAPYVKSELTRKKNDEIHEEPWVQCDTCNQWVHQICGLFSDKEKSGEFQCPPCMLHDRKTGVEKKVWTAKSLPRSKLSDFLERRVAKLLEEEITDEMMQSKDVPPPDKLIIRQVSNIEKNLMVRDKMFQRYKDTKYPSEHRFKSKCICMFQEIHGVSVLLFGMYVHEFDQQEAKCNSRRVYVSYLDSVNYLEPAYLRTKVYHEILIGYLEYVKQRGFHTAHIWACPPLKGDDYILYCHPESQKTPKSDRLRQWYIQMLLKAKEEGVVVDINNMYDEYWSTAAASPTELPYFEGDYWVGLAEELIEKLDEEVKTKKKKDQKSKKPKAGGKDSTVEVEFTDLLMKKLGEVIQPMKDDFLVVKFFPSCSQCKVLIGQGTIWKESKTCLCDACYQSQILNQAKKETPPYIPIVLTLKEKCTDPDDIVESEVFDTRQAFLSLCQTNHYQFDELRRAKHTSMLTLYHIGHPPNGYIYSCNVCKADITTGTRWHCPTCVDYDVCATCFEKKTSVHMHKLEAVGTVTDVMRKAREERKKSIALHMQLLVHASSCEEGGCASLNCEKMKELLRHGAQCKQRATGGCTICRRVWALLQIHARQCRLAECRVPRCKDLREHLRKLALQQQLMDDRRRAAVTEQYSRQGAVAAPGGGATGDEKVDPSPSS